MSERIIHGRNPVLELLEAGMPVDKILVENSGRGREKNGDIVKAAKRASVPVECLPREILDKESGRTNHQGVVARLPRFDYADTEDIIEKAGRAGQETLIVICDHIEDPHNLGAIIRNAEAFGAQGVLIPKKRSAQITPTVIKTSSGAVFHLPVARVSNLVQAIKKLKNAGYWIVGTDVDGLNISEEKKLEGSLAVIIGGEGKGMRELVKKNCDFMVSVPMSGKIQSLNASVASGIVLYEITRRKKGRELP